MVKRNVPPVKKTQRCNVSNAKENAEIKLESSGNIMACLIMQTYHLFGRVSFLYLQKDPLFFYYFKDGGRKVLRNFSNHTSI